jgi:hypothetical protein
MASIETDDRQATPPQSEGQPIGELAGLQTDPHERRGLSADDPTNGVGFRGAFASPNERTVAVDDADRGGLKRDIKADVVLLIHGVAPSCGSRRLPGDRFRLSFTITPCPDTSGVPQKAARSVAFRGNRNETKLLPSAGLSSFWVERGLTARAAPCGTLPYA